MSLMVREKKFYKTFASMTGVIAMQNLITFAVNLADNVMIGGYSQTALSGVAIVNQIQFLLQMLMLGTGSAIGVAEPVSVRVETYGTGKIADEEITALLRKTCDLTPGGIIKKLNLRRPIYGVTALEGHFGAVDRPWEQTDLAEELKRLANI